MSHPFGTEVMEVRAPPKDGSHHSKKAMAQKAWKVRKLRDFGQKGEKETQEELLVREGLSPLI
jgi:hypothetical protein